MNKSETTVEKKAVTKKVKSSPKDEEAKAKVEELLKNTNVAGLVTTQTKEKSYEFDVAEIKKEKSLGWMEQQLDALNKQVESLENEILYYKGELAKVANGVPQSEPTLNVNESLNQNLIALFRHFERVYGLGYTDAKLAHPESRNGVLDKFIEYFPELSNVKTYKYRGNM